MMAGRREFPPLGGLLLVVAAVVATTWPLSTTTRIPGDIDAFFGAWRMAWIADSLRHAPRSIFDAPIFYPHSLTLSYSDSILLSGALTAPFAWMGVSPVTVYNYFALFSLLTAGVAVMYLGHALTGSWSAGALGGIIYTVNPHRMEHLERIELLTTAAVPLFFVVWHRAAARGSAKWAAIAGTCLAVQWYTGMYLGLFLMCVAPLALIDLAWVDRSLRPRLAVGLAAGAVLSLILIAPSILPYLTTREELGPRSFEEVASYSVQLRNFLGVHPRNWLYGDLLAGFGHAERFLFPGILAVVLSAAGLFWASWRIRAVYCSVAVLALLLAMGSNTPFLGLLREWISPFRSIRAPARAADIVLMTVAVFAAVGFARFARTARNSVTAAVAAALACILVAEYRMVPNFWESRPSDPRVMRLLGLDRTSILLEFPVADPGRLDLTKDAHYMFDRIGLWPRLVNGYSGNYPRRYLRLMEELRTFPDARSLAAALHSGATHIVVHERWKPAAYGPALTALFAHPDLTAVGTYNEPEGHVMVFSVRRQAQDGQPIK